MNRISKRLLMAPLLLLLLFLASSCGSQLGVQEADPVTKDEPSTVTLDKATTATPATKETSTKETSTKETSTKEIATKETASKETITEAATKETPAKEAPAAEAPTTEDPAATVDVSDKQVTIEETTKDALVPQSTITISITGDEKKGVILEPTSIDWQDGDSVLDVLKQVTKRNKIPLEYRGSGMLSYVEGIANLYEFDQGASSGWLFKVNGKLATKSAGAVKLNKGDNVEWIYSLELSEEPVEEE